MKQGWRQREWKPDGQAAMTLYLRHEFAEAWKDQDAFEAVDNLSGEIFREVRGRRTFRLEFGGRSYFVKIHRGAGWPEILKNLVSLRKPILGAKNEWLAINALTQLNIPTMTAAAYGEKGSNPARRYSFLITDELKPVQSLETVCAAWQTRRPLFVFKYRLLLEVARLSRLLHSNHICHRDLYLCHFLLRCAAGNEVDESQLPQLSLIDLHRALIRPAFMQRWIKKDISGLYSSALDIGLTRTDLCRFVKAYSGKPLREALNGDATFWQQVSRKAQQIRLRDLRKAEHRLQRTVYKSSALTSRQQSFTRVALINNSVWSPALECLLKNPDAMMKSAIMLKDGDSTTVVAVTVGNRQWVIKRYNMKNPFYAATRLLRPSRAWHSWGSAFRLAGAGIITPAPLLMLEKRWGPLRREAWYVSEMAGGDDLLHALQNQSSDSPAWQSALRQLEQLFGRMYRNRLVHGDMKATNFILQEDRSGNRQLQVIDLDACRIVLNEHRFKKYFARDLRRFYANWRHHDAATAVGALIRRFINL